MILDFEVTSKTINSALFLMSSMSAQVRDNVELELYREKADSDHSTDSFILDTSLVSFIKDIESVGIVIDFDYSHLVDDLPKLFAFIHASSYLLPSSLYFILKKDDKIRQCVEDILHGSLGDGETLLQTYLSELGGLDGQIALVPDLTETLDELYNVLSQTEIFTDMMRNVLNLVHDECLVVESDSQSHQVFRDTSKELIGRTSDAVNLFATYPFYTELNVIQGWFIKDLISPSNFTQYAYLFTTDKSTLPDDLVESYNRSWYHYRVSHMWCADYYAVRQLSIKPSCWMALHAFLYATCETKQEYDERVTILHRDHPTLCADNHVLTNMISELYQG